MVLAKVMTAKADLPSTLAALLAFTQSAAAMVAVVAIARTPEGLFNISDTERFFLCLLTAVVAVVLGTGCVAILSGRSSQPARAGSAASLVISAYWIFLRNPLEEFPGIAVAYAVLPVLILALLALPGLLRAVGRRSGRKRPAPAQGDAPAATEEEPADSAVPPPWEASAAAADEGSEQALSA